MERIYNTNILYCWSYAKRRRNLLKHGFDFADARHVFEGFTITVEDVRHDYGERRFVTLGLLRDIVVCLVHTEDAHEIRVISLRKATRLEADAFARATKGP